MTTAAGPAPGPAADTVESPSALPATKPRGMFVRGLEVFLENRLAIVGVVLLVLVFLTGPLQYLPRCVLAAIVFTIAIGMIDVANLRNIRRESPGEFSLAMVTAATVGITSTLSLILVAVTVLGL